MAEELDIFGFYHDRCLHQQEYVPSLISTLMGRQYQQYQIAAQAPKGESWMDLFELVYGIAVGRACVDTPMYSCYTESPGVVSILVMLSGQLNIEKTDGTVVQYFSAGSVGIGPRSSAENLLLNYMPDKNHKVLAVSIDIPDSLFFKLFPADEAACKVYALPYDDCMLKIDHFCRHAVLNVAEQIMQCDYKNVVEVMSVESLVLDLMTKIATHFSQIFKVVDSVSCCQSRYCSQVRQVIDVLENRYEEKHTIASLSRLVGLNECYLKSFFKAQTGQTIAEYQRRVRMEKAKYFIESQGCSVIEAAQKIGYQNPGHFAVAFRKVYGLSPSSIRNSLVVD